MNKVVLSVIMRMKDITFEEKLTNNSGYIMTVKKYDGVDEERVERGREILYILRERYTEI